MLRPGDKFDRYVLDSVLGEGGMGVVYRAHDTRLDRRVALKIVRPDDVADDARRKLAVDRLMREARVAAALHHPNAVSIFDVGEHEGTPFIAMELVSGRTLRTFVGDRSVPWRDRVRWLVDVGRALEAAHKAGLVHRDVKPENVMVGEDGSIKVLDFGIARRSAGEVDPSAPTQARSIATLTTDGVRVGTPFYMAPEQIRGDAVDGRSDQFAWGVLAYELLTGKSPWRGGTDELGVVASILTEHPPRVRDLAPEIPPQVETVVMRALSKASADRFATMNEAIRALEATLNTSLPPPDVARAPAGEGLRRFSDAEVDEILQRALEEQPDASGTGHATLVAAAREIGVPEERIRRAIGELGASRAEEDDVAAIRRRLLHRLIRHAAAYVAVNVFLLVTAGWHLGKWVLFGWGIGIVMHTISWLFPDVEKERRKLARRDARRASKVERRARRREMRGDPAKIAEGVAMLRRTAELRMRVPSGERVRVAEAPREPVSTEREHEDDARVARR